MDASPNPAYKTGIPFLLFITFYLSFFKWKKKMKLPYFLNIFGIFNPPHELIFYTLKIKFTASRCTVHDSQSLANSEKVFSTWKGTNELFWQDEGTQIFPLRRKHNKYESWLNRWIAPSRHILGKCFHKTRQACYLSTFH